MNHSAWLGLDVGGANLKAASCRGYSVSRDFPLWQRRHELAAELCNLVRSAPRSRRLAVTMTGELADCFQDKSEGVHYILDCIEEAAGDREVAVYLVSGEFVTPSTARRNSHLAAASNWHALATYGCRYLRQGARPAESVAEREQQLDAKRQLGLLLDIGSTTTDIVALSAEAPLTKSRADVDRLQRGELVYTGIRRSPVCAVVTTLPLAGGECPVAQELFATTADAYVLLGALPEDSRDVNTADGRPLTASAARARMARMVCLDRRSYGYNDAVRAAAAIRDAQFQVLHRAVTQVISHMPNAPDTVILSGEGEFLARAVLGPQLGRARIVSLTEELGRDLSRAAPAHAVAVLASEREEVGR